LVSLPSGAVREADADTGLGLGALQACRGGNNSALQQAKPTPRPDIYMSWYFWTPWQAQVPAWTSIDASVAFAAWTDSDRVTTSPVAFQQRSRMGNTLRLISGDTCCVYRNWICCASDCGPLRFGPCFLRWTASIVHQRKKPPMFTATHCLPLSAGTPPSLHREERIRSGLQFDGKASCGIARAGTAAGIVSCLVSPCRFEAYVQRPAPWETCQATPTMTMRDSSRYTARGGPRFCTVHSPLSRRKHTMQRALPSSSSG